MSKEVKRYIDEGKTLPWVMGGFPSGYEPKAAADFQGYFSGEYTFDQMVDQLKGEYEDYFNYMQAKYPGRLCFCHGFVPELARKIYSGADIFLSLIHI